MSTFSLNFLFVLFVKVVIFGRSYIQSVKALSCQGPYARDTRVMKGRVFGVELGCLVSNEFVDMPTVSYFVRGTI